MATQSLVAMSRSFVNIVDYTHTMKDLNRDSYRDSEKRSQ